MRLVPGEPETLSSETFGDALLEVTKVGEYPAFGPSTPARLLRLLDEDRELYLKGRRSEIQGLGIGAFSYYRRVVEQQKNSLLGEIVRVGEKTGADPAVLQILRVAIAENQFYKAMEDVKNAMPPALLINGHNPITLLHRALSQGLHAQSGEECLLAASSIRLVLTELSERLGQVLKDHAELNAAVNRLMNPGT
jgi:hypothetical protein